MLDDSRLSCTKPPLYLGLGGGGEWGHGEVNSVFGAHLCEMLGDETWEEGGEAYLVHTGTVL